MANTYTWSVVALRGFADGTVTEVHWQATATDGVHNAAPVLGIVIMPPKPPSDPSFVPLAKVDAATAIGWAQAILGAARVADIQSQMDADIARQAAPLAYPVAAQPVTVLAAPLIPNLKQ